MTFRKEHVAKLATIQSEIALLKMQEKVFLAAQSMDKTPGDLLADERAKRAKESEELAKVYEMAKALGATVTIKGAQPEHMYAFTVEDYHGMIEIRYVANGVTLDADIMHYNWDVDETYAERKSHAVYCMTTDAWNVLDGKGRRYNHLQKQQDRAMSYGAFNFTRYKRALTSFILAMNVGG